MSHNASSLGKNGIALASLAIFSGQTFGDVSPDYAPLPVYGNIQMGSASCSVTHSATLPTVTWTAIPAGYGYPASAFQCSGFFRLQNLISGGVCTGTFSAPTSTVGGVYTDPYGTVNPNQNSVTFISPGNSSLAASCSGLVSASGISTQMTIYPSCALPIGGGLDNLLTGFAASCGAAN